MVPPGVRTWSRFEEESLRARMGGLVVHPLQGGWRGAGSHIARGGDAAVMMSPSWNCPTRRHHDFGGWCLAFCLPAGTHRGASGDIRLRSEGTRGLTRIGDGRRGACDRTERTSRGGGGGAPEGNRPNEAAAYPPGLGRGDHLQNHSTALRMATSRCSASDPSLRYHVTVQPDCGCSGGSLGNPVPHAPASRSGGGD